MSDFAALQAKADAYILRIHQAVTDLCMKHNFALREGERPIVAFTFPHRCENEEMEVIELDWWRSQGSDKHIAVFVEDEEISYLRDWHSTDDPIHCPLGQGLAEDADVFCLLWQWFWTD